MNKKGFVIELMAFILIGIIVVLFFGGLIYGIGLVNGVMTNTALDTTAVNISSVSNMTINKLNTGMGGLKLMAAVIMIAFILATWVTAYYSSKHPIWIVVYVMIVIIFVIFSIYISNAYESVRDSLPQIVTGFTMADFLILNLPIATSIIGFIGILLSVVGNLASRRVFE